MNDWIYAKWLELRVEEMMERQRLSRDELFYPELFYPPDDLNTLKEVLEEEKYKLEDSLFEI